MTAPFAALALNFSTEQVLSFAAIAGVGLLMLAYAVFIIAAFLGALFSGLGVGMKLVWAIFIICAPFLGALCWFIIGRNNVPSRVHYQYR
ncbi:PLDc N-terminal domain-containing protein [Nocardiopsis coralliicola]